MSSAVSREASAGLGLLRPPRATDLDMGTLAAGLSADEVATYDSRGGFTSRLDLAANQRDRLG